MADKPDGKRRWRIALGLAAGPLLYVLSYFLFGRHTTEESFVNPFTGRYTWHDRSYSFDPWLYTPLARLECKLRGPDTQLVLEGSIARDGGATYIFWSGQPKC